MKNIIISEKQLEKLIMINIRNFQDYSNIDFKQDLKQNNNSENEFI